jgi:hypothetical protein
MRRVLCAIALACGIATVRAADGDFMNCPTQPNEQIWSVHIRALTSKLSVAEGLQPSDFAVTANRIPQSPCGFRHWRWPVSIGILLDTSGSMGAPRNGTTADRSGLASAQAGIERLLRLSGPIDEYFLASASEGATVSVPFTSDVARIRAGLTALPKGRTALVDGMYLALTEMRKAHHQTRALIVFSDGMDNLSIFHIDELRRAFQSSPVPIFLLAPQSRWAGREIENDSNSIQNLVRYVRSVGGYDISIMDRDDMLLAVDRASAAIRAPYILYFSGQKPATVQVKPDHSHANRLFYFVADER